MNVISLRMTLLFLIIAWIGNVTGFQVHRSTSFTTTFRPITSLSVKRFHGRSSSSNSFRLYGRKDGDDDGIKDPNPGGMNNYPNNNNDDSGENPITSFLRWTKTPEAKEDVKVYTTSLAFALLLRFLIIEPRYIPSLSMYPTFEVGDQLAVEKVTKRYRPFYRNEIVVFNPPQTFQDIMVSNFAAAKKSKEALIKRIVATEGDEVEVNKGKLFINGVLQDEPFTAEDAAYEFGPVTVPPGNLLVLGDNRNHSMDGHIWGFLPKENVIGRAVFVYWPPWRIGNGGDRKSVV